MPCKYDTPYIMLSEHVRLKWKPGSETEEEINLDCTDITMERQECKSLVGWPGKCHIKENRGLPFRGVRSTVKKKDRITDLSKRVSYFWLWFYKGGDMSVTKSIIDLGVKYKDWQFTGHRAGLACGLGTHFPSPGMSRSFSRSSGLATPIQSLTPSSTASLSPKPPCDLHEANGFHLCPSAPPGARALLHSRLYLRIPQAGASLWRVSSLKNEPLSLEAWIPRAWHGARWTTRAQ